VLGCTDVARGRAPPWGRHQTGFDHFQALEALLELVEGAQLVVAQLGALEAVSLVSLPSSSAG
jgi:hypothetical protein